jgi:hypothetical protein
LRADPVRVKCEDARVALVRVEKVLLRAGEAPRRGAWMIGTAASRSDGVSCIQQHEGREIVNPPTLHAGTDFDGAALVKVRIIRPVPGEVDGMRIDSLTPGLTYELSPTLATWLVCEGYAEPFIDFLSDRRRPDLRAAPARSLDRRRRS